MREGQRAVQTVDVGEGVEEVAIEAEEVVVEVGADADAEVEREQKGQTCMEVAAFDGIGMASHWA